MKVRLFALLVSAAICWSCGNKDHGFSIFNDVDTEFRYSDGTPFPGGTWWISNDEFFGRSTADVLALDDFFTGLSCEDIPEAEANNVAASGCIDADGDTFLASPCDDTSSSSTETFTVDLMDIGGNPGTAEIDCSLLGAAEDSDEPLEVDSTVVNPVPPPP